MGDLIEFDRFVVDLDRGVLSDGTRQVVLQAQVARLLSALLERPGDLVTHDRLRWALWPNRDFGEWDEGLKTAVYRLRKVLGESALAPRLIETVPRRGYRYSGTGAVAPPGPLQAANKTRTYVGRSQELAALAGELDRARRGGLRLAFVTGGAGIGKTAFVEALASACGPDVCVASGRALARCGPDDAFGPLIEVVHRLASSGPAVAGRFARHAPCWMSFVPSLSGRYRERVGSDAAGGATRARMLRELGQALESVAEERPLLLTLDDLHWADESTLEAVDALTRSAVRARLLLVCTWRPHHGAAATACEALRESVHGRPGLAVTNVKLGVLSMSDVSDYLERRYPRLADVAPLSRALHEHTDGHPLFVMACLHALEDDDRLVEEAGIHHLRCEVREVRNLLPPSLIALMKERVADLPPGQQALLRAASVIGAPFSPAMLARVTGQNAADVERDLDGLAHRSDLLMPSRAGTVNGRRRSEYEFAQGFYARALERTLDPATLRSLHASVASDIEAHCDAAVPAAAVRLAVHLDRAGLAQQAVRAYTQAADVALARTAYAEGARLVARALELLEQAPASPTRDIEEVELLLRHGAAVSWTHGFGDPGVNSAFTRACSLCEQLPNSPRIVPALLGLSRYYVACGPAARGVALARRALAPSSEAGDEALLLEALQHCGAAEATAGDQAAAERSTRAAMQVMRAMEAAQISSTLYLTGLDARAIVRVTRMYVLWFVGRLAEALATAEDLHRRLAEIDHGDTRLCALAWLAVFEVMAEDFEGAARDAELVVAETEGREDAINFRPFALLALGRALCRQGKVETGIRSLDEGITKVPPTWRPLGRAFLAQARLDHGDRAGARDAVDTALADSASTGIGIYDPELLRLRGLAARDHDEAAVWLARAGARAREQGATWMALRATLSQCHVKPTPETIDQLRELYGVMRDEPGVDVSRVSEWLSLTPNA